MPPGRDFEIGGDVERTTACMTLICGALAAIGCQTALVRRGSSIEAGAPVLLMPGHVEFYIETAGAGLEPDAEASAVAARNLEEAVRAALQERGCRTIPFRSPDDPERQHLYLQLRKLESAVDDAIIASKYASADSGLSAMRAERLPTMKGRFEWSLGARTRVLQQDSGARYALFLSVQDSNPGAHRVAVTAVVATIFNQAVATGQQQARASLVDLATGDVVWFNFFYRAGTSNATLLGLKGVLVGDLRQRSTAGRFVDQLLDALPLGAPR